MGRCRPGWTCRRRSPDARPWPHRPGIGCASFPAARDCVTGVRLERADPPRSVHRVAVVAVVFPAAVAFLVAGDFSPFLTFSSDATIQAEPRSTPRGRVRRRPHPAPGSRSLPAFAAASRVGPRRPSRARPGALGEPTYAASTAISPTGPGRNAAIGAHAPSTTVAGRRRPPRHRRSGGCCHPDGARAVCRYRADESWPLLTHGGRDRTRSASSSAHRAAGQAHDLPRHQAGERLGEPAVTAAAAMQPDGVPCGARDRAVDAHRRRSRRDPDRPLYFARTPMDTARGGLRARASSPPPGTWDERRWRRGFANYETDLSLLSGCPKERVPRLDVRPASPSSGPSSPPGSTSRARRRSPIPRGCLGEGRRSPHAHPVHSFFRRPRHASRRGSATALGPLQ